mgnify:CR=1 FL=1
MPHHKCHVFCRPLVPQHINKITETAENRAPQTDVQEIIDSAADPVGSESSNGSATSSLAEIQQQGAAGSITGTRFMPSHVRSSSEPPFVGHIRSASQHSRLSGYYTGYSNSSSVEGNKR